MAKRLLIVTAVKAEADAIGSISNAMVVFGGIGRTNAAATTTQAILEDGPFDLVINAGVAGSLSGSGVEITQAVLASKCIYFEEGVITPSGFTDMDALGFSLGDFPGNCVPVDENAYSILRDQFVCGPIATVATCSGSDDAAMEVVKRTGAIAEAMEGAAVVHAALRLGTGAIELRVISNTTGDRNKQQWQLEEALNALGKAVMTATNALSHS